MQNRYYINWVDGMKINKSHFLHSDQVNTAFRTFDNRYFLTTYEYGLGEQNANKHRDLLTIDDNLLRITQCEALSTHGVEFIVENDNNVHISLNSYNSQIGQNPDLEYAVVLTVDSIQYQTLGEPDPQELPPRFPFRKPSYALSIVPIKTKGINLNNATSICVGKLKPENNRLIIDDGFIPSCNKACNHGVLMEQYIRVERMLDEIHSNAIVVVQNAISKKRHGEINDLATNTFYIMEKMVFFLCEKLPQVRSIYKEQSPIYLFTSLNSFARIILSSLACLKSEDKEALLRYFESHLGFKPHQFESEIKSLANMKYRHFELQQCFEEVFQFLETIRTYVSKSIQLEFHSAERVDVLNETVIKKRKLDIF